MLSEFDDAFEACMYCFYETQAQENGKVNDQENYIGLCFHITGRVLISCLIFFLLVFFFFFFFFISLLALFYIL